MIAIRSLQHYLYCPHRWGMLYLDGQWQDNAFTVMAGQVHERVHAEKVLKQTARTSSFGGVTVYSDMLGIYGKADLVEFVKDTNGIIIQGLDGRYSVNIVEYKPTQPKMPSVADRIQLYAQCRCAAEIFKCQPKAYLYYADVRRRTLVSFTEEDEKLLLKLVAEIDSFTEKQSAPPPVYGKKCNGCSLADSCMPRVKAGGVKAMIMGANE